MSTIAVVKAAQGFMPANKRPACKNCTHVFEMAAAHGGNLSSWQCNKGGFFVPVLAVCEEHQPRPGYVKSFNLVAKTTPPPRT